MSKTKPALIVAGSLLTAICAAWGAWTTLDSSIRPALALLWGACGLAAGLWWVCRTRGGRRLWWLIWIVAVVARLALWWSPPVLSDDVYRYVWDGRVSLTGVNPYRYAPSDTRLTLPRDQDWGHINHKDIPTIYPPLSQLLFAAGARVVPSAWTFKAIFGLIDLGLGLMLLVGVRRAKRGPPDAALVLYLWHPLVIWEYAGSGHVDTLWALLFVACLLDVESGRPGRAVVWLAGAIGAKLIALAFVPLIIARIGWRRVALAGILAACTYLPFADAGFGLWSGLQAYSLFWQFNGFVHPLLTTMPGGSLWARPVVALIGLVLAIGIARRRAELWWSVQLTLVAMIALLPVNYPWYWALLVATVVMRPSLPLHLFSLSLMLTYGVLPAYYDTGLWHLNLGIRCTEAVLLLWSAASLWRERPARDHGRG